MTGPFQHRLTANCQCRSSNFKPANRGLPVESDEESLLLFKKYHNFHSKKKQENITITLICKSSKLPCKTEDKFEYKTIIKQNLKEGEV